MERTTGGGIVAAQDTMVYGWVFPRALGRKALGVKLKLISAYDIIRQSAAVDQHHELNACSLTLRVEGTDGYLPSAKRVFGFSPASNRSKTEKAFPMSDRATPCTS